MEEELGLHALEDWWPESLRDSDVEIDTALPTEGEEEPGLDAELDLLSSEDSEGEEKCALSWEGEEEPSLDVHSLVFILEEEDQSEE